MKAFLYIILSPLIAPFSCARDLWRSYKEQDVSSRWLHFTRLLIVSAVTIWSVYLLFNPITLGAVTLFSGALGVTVGIAFLWVVNAAARFIGTGVGLAFTRLKKQKVADHPQEDSIEEDYISEAVERARAFGSYSYLNNQPISASQQKSKSFDIKAAFKKAIVFTLYGDSTPTIAAPFTWVGFKTSIGKPLLILSLFAALSYAVAVNSLFSGATSAFIIDFLLKDIYGVGFAAIMLSFVVNYIYRKVKPSVANNVPNKALVAAKEAVDLLDKIEYLEAAGQLTEEIAAQLNKVLLRHIQDVLPMLDAKNAWYPALLKEQPLRDDEIDDEIKLKRIYSLTAEQIKSDHSDLLEFLRDHQSVKVADLVGSSLSDVDSSRSLDEESKSQAGEFKLPRDRSQSEADKYPKLRKIFARFARAKLDPTYRPAYVAAPQEENNISIEAAARENTINQYFYPALAILLLAASVACFFFIITATAGFGPYSMAWSLPLAAGLGFLATTAGRHVLNHTSAGSYGQWVMIFTVAVIVLLTLAILFAIKAAAIDSLVIYFGIAAIVSAAFLTFLAIAAYRFSNKTPEQKKEDRAGKTYKVAEYGLIIFKVILAAGFLYLAFLSFALQYFISDLGPGNLASITRYVINLIAMSLDGSMTLLGDEWLRVFSFLIFTISTYAAYALIRNVFQTFLSKISDVRNQQRWHTAAKIIRTVLLLGILLTLFFLPISALPFGFYTIILKVAALTACFMPIFLGNINLFSTFDKVFNKFLGLQMLSSKRWLVVREMVVLLILTGLGAFFGYLTIGPGFFSGLLNSSINALNIASFLSCSIVMTMAFRLKQLISNHRNPNSVLEHQLIKMVEVAQQKKGVDFSAVGKIDMASRYLERIESIANAAKFLIRRDREGLGKINNLLEAQGAAIARLFPNRKEGDRTDLPEGVYTYEMQRFSDQLIQLMAEYGFSSKDIFLAEALRVWQGKKAFRKGDKDAPVIRKLETVRTKITIGGLTVEQIDTPIRSPLTDKQKEELLAIHADDEQKQAVPAWFKALPNFAQVYLKKIVPKSMAGDWSKYEKWRPTTLRHIPGEANAWEHQQIIYDVDGKPISHTISRRQGVPSSNLMPLKDKNGQTLTDQQNSATENIAQMLDSILPEAKNKPSAQNRFLQAWGLPPNALLCPVLLGGLVTRRAQSTYFYSAVERTVNTKEDNNERMYQHKKEAIEAYRSTAEQHGCVLFDLNVGFNASHYKDFDYTSVVDHSAFIDHVRKFIATVETDSAYRNDPDIKAALNRLEFLVQQMEEFAKPETNIDGRNRALHMAALYDLTTRLLEGISTGNCKSSKDRKGTEILYTDAMEIYYAIFGEDYSYDASPTQRAIFIDIFCCLYLAGQQLKTANFNSPGSEGVKGGTIFDEDMKARLKELHAYHQINEIGDYNKPGTMWHKYWPKYRSAIKTIPLAAGLGLGVMYFLGAALHIQFSLVAALYFSPLCIGLPVAIMAVALFYKAAKIKKNLKLLSIATLLLSSMYFLGVYAAPTASILAAVYSALPFVAMSLLLLTVVFGRWLKEWNNVRTLTFTNPKTVQYAAKQWLGDKMPASMSLPVTAATPLLLPEAASDLSLGERRGAPFVAARPTYAILHDATRRESKAAPANKHEAIKWDANWEQSRAAGFAVSGRVISAAVKAISPAAIRGDSGHNRGNLPPRL